MSLLQSDLKADIRRGRTSADECRAMPREKDGRNELMVNLLVEVRKVEEKRRDDSGFPL